MAAGEHEEPLDFSIRADQSLPPADQMREYVRITREILDVLERACDVDPYMSIMNISDSMHAMLLIADSSSRNVVQLSIQLQQLKARQARLN